MSDAAISWRPEEFDAISCLRDWADLMIGEAVHLMPAESIDPSRPGPLLGVRQSAAWPEFERYIDARLDRLWDRFNEATDDRAMELRAVAMDAATYKTFEGRMFDTFRYYLAISWTMHRASAALQSFVREFAFTPGSLDVALNTVALGHEDVDVESYEIPTEQLARFGLAALRIVGFDDSGAFADVPIPPIFLRMARIVLPRYFDSDTGIPDLRDPDPAPLDDAVDPGWPMPD